MGEYSTIYSKDPQIVNVCVIFHRLQLEMIPEWIPCAYVVSFCRGMPSGGVWELGLLGDRVNVYNCVRDS